MNFFWATIFTKTSNFPAGKYVLYICYYVYGKRTVVYCIYFLIRHQCRLGADKRALDNTRRRGLTFPSYSFSSRRKNSESVRSPRFVPRPRAFSWNVSVETARRRLKRHFKMATRYGHILLTTIGLCESESRDFTALAYNSYRFVSVFEWILQYKVLNYFDKLTCLRTLRWDFYCEWRLFELLLQ